MSNYSYEALPLSSPEYHQLASSLYTVATEVMESNPGLVAVNEKLDVRTLRSIQLRSPEDHLITIEKELKHPLPKDPDWLSVTPRITKVESDTAANYELAHKYVYDQGLVIDLMNYRVPNSAFRNVTETIENELSLEDLVQLTDDLKNWAPQIQAPPKWARVVKVVDTILKFV